MLALVGALALAACATPPSTGEASLSGTLEAVDGSSLKVDGKLVELDGPVELEGTVRIGEQVVVKGELQTDGTFLAQAIQGLAAGSSAPYGRLELVGAIDSMEDGLWVVNGLSFLITPETEINGTFIVGDLVKVHAVFNAQGELVAREIEPAEYTEMPDSQKVEFYGTVDAIGDAEWTVDGQTLLIDPSTKIKGDIQVGDTVKVEAYANADGQLVAHEIEHSDDASGEDSRDGEHEEDRDDDHDENDDDHGGEHSQDEGDHGSDHDGERDDD